MSLACAQALSFEVPVIDLGRSQLKPIRLPLAERFVQQRKGRYLRLDDELFLQLFIHTSQRRKKHRLASDRCKTNSEYFDEATLNGVVQIGPEWRRNWRHNDQLWIGLAASTVVLCSSLLGYIWIEHQQQRFEWNQGMASQTRERERNIERTEQVIARYRANQGNRQHATRVDRVSDETHPPIKRINLRHTEPDPVSEELDENLDDAVLADLETVDTDGDLIGQQKLLQAKAVRNTVYEQDRTLTDLEVFDIHATINDYTFSKDIRNEAYFVLRELRDAHRVPNECVETYSDGCQTILARSYAGGAPNECEHEGWDNDACQAAFESYWGKDM